MEYQIMAEPKKRVVVNNGYMHKIRLPEGATSIIDLVRYGMSLHPTSSELASKAVGLHRDSYSFVRKMLLLKARQIATESEEKQINKALSVIEDERSLAGAKRLANPVLDRYWVKNTHSGEHRDRALPQTIATRKRRARLENTLFAIREACTNNDELEIPTMSRQDREEMLNTLSESIGSLSLLKQRLMGEQK